MKYSVPQLLKHISKSPHVASGLPHGTAQTLHISLSQKVLLASTALEANHRLTLS